MDKREKIITVVKSLHNYQSKVISDSDMIKVVCDYYDFIKDENLSESDLQFLKKIANTVGIPHYFDHLEIFQKKEISLNSFSFDTVCAKIYESTLHTSDSTKLHKYQKKVLSLYTPHNQNRHFLSASTSFGKTFLVYEIIKKIRYKNIVLIFPTIALLAENLERLHRDDFFSSYKIHTLSDVKPEDIKSNSIYIYTPERFLSFLEKNRIYPNFDFIFIDEVYKIDNSYIIDEDERKENERDVSYRIAAYYSVIGDADILFAGPYIEKYSDSFEKFLKNNNIKKCDFNEIEIVSKTYHKITTSKFADIGDDTTIEFDDDENGKADRLKRISHILTAKGKKDGFIVYCATPPDAEKYAKFLPELIEYQSCQEDYKTFVTHVSKEYGEDWVVVNCLKKGIGVHHGLIPKYIQKEIISFFNMGTIRAITSTTTITEGVNTSAKYLIVTHNKKGNKPLKRFDAKNIVGRAGRFDKHYSGRVIILLNKFLDDLNAEKEAINHKNYDLNSKKDEIDLFYSSDEFLTDEDRLKRDSINLEQLKRNIPDEILNMFKVVSKAHKIDVYDRIIELNSNQHANIRTLIQKVNSPGHVGIDWNGLQIVLDCIQPIVNTQLNGLIERKTNQGEGEHSILIPMLYNYLETGFKGLVDFKRDKQGKNIDEATRDTAKFVYNTAKYQLVKYFGVFNVMYRLYRSKSEFIDFDKAPGIDRLLTKLEYNALTELGRKVSDYGVPTKVLQYYESSQNEFIKNSFDEFERKSFSIVENIINR